MKCNTQVSIRLSRADKEKINQIVSQSGAINTADFIRTAVREKISREANQ